MLHHNVDYTPYEGMELNAWPKSVISRGELTPTTSVIDKTEENTDDTPKIPENNN